MLIFCHIQEEAESLTRLITNTASKSDPKSTDPLAAETAWQTQAAQHDDELLRQALEDSRPFVPVAGGSSGRASRKAAANVNISSNYSSINSGNAQSGVHGEGYANPVIAIPEGSHLALPIYLPQSCITVRVKGASYRATDWLVPERCRLAFTKKEGCVIK